MADTPRRITIAGISSQYVHASLSPWCLMAGLAAYAQSPYTAQVVEGTVNEPRERLLNRLIDSQPQVLGLSCYIWNISCIAELLPGLRAALPDCVIILGGPEVSYNAGEVLTNYPQVDYVLCGEGEQPFAAFIDALGGIGSVDQVSGLCYRTESGLHESPAHQHAGMQPSPYTPAFFEALGGRIAYLETSRGCPYSCAFCLSGRGERLRQADMDRVQQEILLLANAGSQTIKLVDRTFNADRARAADILEHLISQHGSGIPEGVTFHFEIAGDLLDERTLALVETAPPGLFKFEIGLQSMHEHTLRLVRRRTDMGFLAAQVSRLIACGTAHVHLDLIAGLPEEGLPAFIEGFNAAYALRPQALQLGFLKLLHGSAMREHKEDYPCDFDPAPPYQVISTPDMSEADFDVLRIAERALDKLHNAGRFQGTLRYLTQNLAIPPFELFYKLGQAIMAAEAGKGSLPLDSLTNLVYEQLCLLLPDQQALLRDLMLTDRLASTPSPVLPNSLKRKDARFHTVKRALAKQYPRAENTPRAIGFLYAGEQDVVLWCDYERKDPVSGLYPLQRSAVADLLSP